MNGLVQGLSAAMSSFDPTAFGALAAIIFVSAFVQGMVGFAFGMISMGFASLVLDAKTASFLVSPLAALNIALTLWSVRGEVRFPIVAPMVAGALVGMPVGVAILLAGSVFLIKVMVSVLLVCVGVTRLLPGGVPVHPLPYWWGGVAGFGTGVIGGATNMGGPPLIAYAARQPWPPALFKAALLTTFLFSTTGKTLLLMWEGSLNRTLLALTVLLAPVVVVGSLAGIRLFDRIDRAVFGKIVAVMLVGLGVWVMVHGK